MSEDTSNTDSDFGIEQLFVGSRGDRGDTNNADTVDYSAKKLYLMQMGAWTKIGVSENPRNRRANIQTSSPLKVKLLATIRSDSPSDIEDILHQYFSPFQTESGGEWFTLPDHELEELCDCDDLLLEDANTRYSQDASSEQLVQSMPSGLVKRVDRIQQDMGLETRNETINKLVEMGAREYAWDE